MPLTIEYEPCVVGDSPRVRVISPFSAKDAIKSSRVARFEGKRLIWTIPRTRLCYVAVRDAVNERFPNSEHKVHPDLAPVFAGAASIQEVKPPALPRAVFNPWPHQRLGSGMIGQLEGCLLAWEMGAGKTKAVFDAAIEYGFMATLVVCPSSVISVWERQRDIHVPQDMRDRFVVLPLTSSRNVAARAALLEKVYEQEVAIKGRQLLVAVNYEAVWRTELARAVKRIPFDCVVADESHKIANFSTKTCKFLALEVSPRAKHRVCLSGTPLSNGPQDAFGQMLFCEPAILGTSVTAFRSEYCVMGGFENRQVVAFRNLDKFSAAMGRITSRVRIADVVELPEFTDEEVLVDLGSEARRVYSEVKDHFVSEISGGVVSVTNAVAKLMRLQQITSGFVVVSDDDAGESQALPIDGAKAEALSDIVDAAPRNEPIVVFTKFVRDIETVHRIAGERKRESYEISGKVKQQLEWEKSCDAGNGPLIAVQIQAGGVGIDLTKARYCVYYSLGFSLSDYEQSRARVRRPGQKRAVLYYHLVARGTVDAMVYRALKGKRDVVESVVSELTSGVVCSE